MSAADFTELLRRLRPDVDATLDELLPAPEEEPRSLHEAMRYSVFAGGKRVRPALVVLTGELFGARRGTLLPGAAALEMIHTFSLVHDDLPALDNDDQRRGRATLHRQFDEATAILAGDALLNAGLEVLARHPASVPAEQRLQAVQLVAEAVGPRGMIGGQVDDLLAERHWPEDAAAALDRIHRRKTGALLAASIRLGGLYAGVGASHAELLANLGMLLGLMFQIADDVLDVVGNAHDLGKTVGKDAAARKLTYPGLHGIEASRARLQELARESRRLATSLRDGGGYFVPLIDFLQQRNH